MDNGFESEMQYVYKPEFMCELPVQNKYEFRHGSFVSENETKFSYNDDQGFACKLPPANWTGGLKNLPAGPGDVCELTEFPPRSRPGTTKLPAPSAPMGFDDTKILKQIWSTHTRGRARDVSIEPILHVIQDIFTRARTNDLVSHGAAESFTEKLKAIFGRTTDRAGAAFGTTTLDPLAAIIRKIYCEFCCKCKGDTNTSTMAILTLLAEYSWDAKMVIATAAFALIYGEMWLVTLLSETNPLAHCIAVLKQLPGVIEFRGVLKAHLSPLHELIEVLLKFAAKLIEFRGCCSSFDGSSDHKSFVAVHQHIAITTYWIVRSIVASGGLIAASFDLEMIGSATEACDITILVHKVQTLFVQLEERVQICIEIRDRKTREEEFVALFYILGLKTHKDNLRVLKALLNAKNCELPLVKASIELDIEVLRGKTVLFFISDLEVCMEELIFLKKTYNESRKKSGTLQYEIVWLPILEAGVWTEEHVAKYRELQVEMPWYTLKHHSLLCHASVRYITEVWRFVRHKSMIVSLDAFGQVVCQNAFHMMLIWGNSAYPFSKIREEELWLKQAWKLDFVLHTIHPNFPKWIGQGDTKICFFGGDNISWIREYTRAMREHAAKIGIKLELVYVGKHNAKEAVIKIIEVIKAEHLAHTFENYTQVWHFWSRFESMLISGIHCESGNSSLNSEIIKKVLFVLSFGGGDHGWGCIGSGLEAEIIVEAMGDVLVACFARFEEWEIHVKERGFLAALSEFISFAHPATHGHCLRLVLPPEASEDLDVVPCAHCGHGMEKYLMYKCCTGH